MKCMVKVAGSKHTTEWEDFRRVVNGMLWETSTATYCGSGGNNESVMVTPNGRYFLFNHGVNYRSLCQPPAIIPIEKDDAVRLLGLHDPDSLKDAFPELEVPKA